MTANAGKSVRISTTTCAPPDRYGRARQSAGGKLTETITGRAKDTSTKTRRLARRLRPVYLVDCGLEFSLRELAANTRSVFGAACRFVGTVPARIREHSLAAHLFHIVQEAVPITLEGKNERILLSVKDDGKGISEDLETDGMGLRIMRFRANMIHAVLDIRPLEAGGTLVQVSVGGNETAAIDL